MTYVGEMTYMVKVLGTLVLSTAFVGNTYTCCCSVWEYGLCNDIEIS